MVDRQKAALDLGHFHLVRCLALGQGLMRVMNEMSETCFVLDVVVSAVQLLLLCRPGSCAAFHSGG